MNRTVSFCFDDGFAATAAKVRRLFEARDLTTCFAILASPGKTTDPFIRAAPIADWGVWREATAAGHEVAPHGWAHEHLGRLPFSAATASVQRTWEAFASELPGFDPADCLFHLAYLAAPPQVTEWIGARALGVRTGSPSAGQNDWASLVRGGPVSAVTFGPDGVEARAETRLKRFLALEDGWLVLVFHGLDGEGWGPLPAPGLERLLDLAQEAGAAVEPPNAVLRRRLAAGRRQAGRPPGRRRSRSAPLHRT